MGIITIGRDIGCTIETRGNEYEKTKYGEGERRVYYMLDTGGVTDVRSGASMCKAYTVGRA